MLPIVIASLAAALPLFAPYSAPRAPETWVIHIEGDARSLAVVRAAHKAFSYRAPRNLNSEYRIQLVDAGDAVVATIPLDLGDFCMDPDHRGKEPHVRGDVLVAHSVSMTVKIPALARAAELRIVKVVAGAEGGQDRVSVLGKIGREALLTLVAKGPGSGESGTRERRADDKKGGV